jgi:hypothetical protein
MPTGEGPPYKNYQLLTSVVPHDIQIQKQLDSTVKVNSKMKHMISHTKEYFSTIPECTLCPNLWFNIHQQGTM